MLKSERYLDGSRSGSHEDDDRQQALHGFTISARMLSRDDVDVAARFPLLIGRRGASNSARTTCDRFLVMEVARLPAKCAVADSRVGALN